MGQALALAPLYVIGAGTFAGHMTGLFSNTFSYQTQLYLGFRSMGLDVSDKLRDIVET